MWLVFVVCAISLPRLFSILGRSSFDENSAVPDHFYVAVVDANGGFQLAPLKGLDISRHPLFVQAGESRDHVNNDGSGEPLERVRILQRSDAGALMESVRATNHEIMTARYRVVGQRVVPLRLELWGIGNLFQGMVAAALTATIVEVVLARRRHRKMAPASATPT